MGLPNQPPGNGADWNRWRGGVDTKLNSVVTRQAQIEQKVDDLPEKIETRMEKVIKAQADDSFIGKLKVPPDPKNGKPVTFQWLAEKALVPILLAIGMLILGLVLGGGL